MPIVTVRQGDCFNSIADETGFFWQTLWNHSKNKHLQEGGRHPNTLMPGDVVFIPEKTVKDYTRKTGARYTWKVKGIPAKLRMQLMWDGQPRKNEQDDFHAEENAVIVANGNRVEEEHSAQHHNHETRQCPRHQPARDL